MIVIEFFFKSIFEEVRFFFEKVPSHAPTLAGSLGALQFRKFKVYEQLNHSNYLAGDEFTFADVSMAHLLTQLQSVGGPVLQNEKAKTWLQNFNSRKAYVT